MNTRPPLPGPFEFEPHGVGDAALIDRLCLAFEDRWRRGEFPLLAEMLEQVDAPLQGALFVELLAIELAYRRQRGETPQKDDYLGEFAKFERQVECAFATAGEGVGTLEPGSSVGRYTIERELGRGRFGTVFLAHDQQLDRRVAIKIPGSGPAVTQAAIDRLVEEVRTAARLQHPGIVRLYDVQALADRRLYAVMQWIDGTTLADALEHERPAPERAADLLAQVADALAYAHHRGFVHRDLSPDNILLDASEDPHIADFGLAVHYDDQHWRAGEQAGSWAYMAPEQVRGETHRLDGRADIWALGVILYEACAGRRPFVGDSVEQLREAILKQDPRPLRQWNAAVSAELERVVQRCLAKAPEDRYATAGDVAQALRAAVRPKGRHPAWAVALATAALAAVLVVGLLLGSLRSRSPASRQSPKATGVPQAAAEIDFLVWRGGAWSRVQDTGILPVVHGDQVRLQITTEPPGFLYVIWIGSSGSVTAIYPWQLADWEERVSEEPLTELALPTDSPDEVWTMEIEATGWEAIVLLARDAPLPDDVSLPQLLGDVPSLAEESPFHAVRFDERTLEVLHPNRSVDPAHSTRVTSVLISLQQHLRKTLAPHCRSMHALAFPVSDRR